MPLSTTVAVGFFAAVVAGAAGFAAVDFGGLGFGFGAVVRARLRDAASVRLGFGLGEALGEVVGLGEAVTPGDPVTLGSTGTELGGSGSTNAGCGAVPAGPAVSCTAPTVPPTASATPTTAVAAIPAGEERIRVRRELPVTGRSFHRCNKSVGP
ncbi:hypothetical protein GCM10012279_19520 [Micromonospora yangpuensis]|nr:hypothetical protein GCM10012279_19520 [Micromonospora yangpuensis]